MNNFLTYIFILLTLFGFTSFKKKQSTEIREDGLLDHLLPEKQIIHNAWTEHKGNLSHQHFQYLW